MEQMIVTTGDLKKEYEVIGPIYFSVTNKGLFGSQLGTLVKKYRGQLDELKKSNQIKPERPDWGFLYGEFSTGQNDFDKAFFIAVEEIKIRAKLLSADAVICLRQDIDLDTTGFQHFYLQMYGTAIKFSS